MVVEELREVLVKVANYHCHIWVHGDGTKEENIRSRGIQDALKAVLYALDGDAIPLKTL